MLQIEHLGLNCKKCITFKPANIVISYLKHKNDIFKKVLGLKYKIKV